MMLSRLLLLFALAFTAACPAFAADDDVNQDILATTLVKEGETAPGFTCQDTTGRSHALSALKGKVVLLYFFTSRNGASLPDLRYLQSEIQRKVGGRSDFQLLAIGRDYQREELVKLGGENKLSFPLVADPKQEIYHLYFSKYAPRTVLIRADGTIAYQTSGAGYDKILVLQNALARELARQPH